MDTEAPPSKKQRVKPKVLKDWNDEDVFKLISLVECEPCLWNASEDGYHNKNLRDNAWSRITEQFQDKYVQADLNVKWTNLRIQYRGYAGRAKTKSGQGAVDPPKWKFFGAMGFVGRAEEQQTQPTTSNIFFEDEPEISSLDCTVKTPPPLSTKRRPQAANAPSAATQIAETMREAVAAMKERNQNALDANTTFANYLLSELRTLSDDASATVRNKVTLFFLECVENARKEKL